MYAFVLDSNKQPLIPCRMARARILLKQGRAAVFRRYPFTIIMKDVVKEDCIVKEHRLKIDPGSKVTGMAVLQEQGDTGKVVFAEELQHRGQQIKDALESRKACRRNRRNRKTRYRKRRFLNRRKPEGWLPPSLIHRVLTTMTWVSRIRRYCPIASLSMELVKFDLQKMENPEISGIEYQQGELQGYEVREYLLEKWHRKCAYCSVENVPLQIEHIVCRAKGGTDRLPNLCLACEPCNHRKGTQDVAEFLKNKPEVLKRVLAQAKMPLKDATAVNATRWELWRRLDGMGLPLETGSGGLTKFNRSQRGLPKVHWIDAACVGASTQAKLKIDGVRALHVKSTGHGCRQRVNPDRHGFPRGHAKRAKKFLGFQTGDIVKAVVPSGKYRGAHVGRVVIRHRPNFLVNRVDVHPKYITLIHKADGCECSFGMS